MATLTRGGGSGTIFRQASWGDQLEMWHTSVAVTTYTTGYRERSGKRWVNQEKYPSPLRRRVISEGVWLRFPPGFGGGYSRDGLNALAHALAHVYSIVYPCDPAEIATHTVVNSGNGGARIYIFDTTAGGLGMTSAVLDQFTVLLELAREKLTACVHCDPDPGAFDRGCPACIQVPRWYEDNEHLSKREAIQIMERIQTVAAACIEPRVQVLPAYRRRLAGGLTAVNVSTEIEETEEVAVSVEQSFGKRVFRAGSVILTRAGQTVTVSGVAFKEGYIYYSVRTRDGREMHLRDLGRNLSLIQGEQEVWCTNCGAEGLPLDAPSCPQCGERLV